jgi:DNA/RNA-binding domain of Phe-tRNA-synthetase-like protein
MIIVHEELWSRFPGMKIVCVSSEGLNNTVENMAVQEFLAKAQDSIKPESLEHPNLLAWRKAYEIAGISMGKYPVSILAMVKRIAKGGRVPSINPLVDFYNAISISNVTPLGGMDLDQLDGKQQLRFTKDGEQFYPIGAEVPDTLPAGEICYSDGSHVTTRHLAWRQAGISAITPETSRFVLIFEIVPGVLEGLEESVTKQILEGLEKYFGIKGVVEVVEQF